MKKLPEGEALRRKKLRDLEYYKKNKDVIKERVSKRYYETIDEQRKYFKKYHAKNAEKKRQISSVWKRQNKHKVNEQVRRRQAREALATPSWLSREHIFKMEQMYWLCHDLKCVSGDIYHVDHIVPLGGKNVCGLHVPWNLQILPADINLSKGAKYEP